MVVAAGLGAVLEGDGWAGPLAGMFLIGLLLYVGGLVVACRHGYGEARRLKLSRPAAAWRAIRDLIGWIFRYSP